MMRRLFVARAGVAIACSAASRACADRHGRQSRSGSSSASRAGGSTDVTARIIAQALSERLGQPVIVENRAGRRRQHRRGGRRQRPIRTVTRITDVDQFSTFAANPSLYKSLPFDVQNDFAPIALTAFIPNLLVVNPSVPASNVADFIAYLKANPDKLNFASAGNGTSQHLSGEAVQFARRRADDAHLPIAAARRPSPISWAARCRSSSRRWSK